MTSIHRLTSHWLTLAAVMTFVCGIVYVATQQMWRQMANDPQVQIARDAAAALAAGISPESVVPGAPVDFATSLAPFLMVLAEDGQVLASSGTLHGQKRRIPAGVLDHVRDHGEERVTWQPEAGVRVAAVVERTASRPARFVVAGRSLQETEERIAAFQRLLAVAWILALAGIGVVVAIVETGAN